MLTATVRELARRGWVAKRWTTRKGITRGGRPFNKASLHYLLTNVTWLTSDSPVVRRAGISQSARGARPAKGKTGTVIVDIGCECAHWNAETAS